MQYKFFGCFKLFLIKRYNIWDTFLWFVCISEVHKLKKPVNSIVSRPVCAKVYATSSNQRVNRGGTVGEKYLICNECYVGCKLPDNTMVQW